MRALKTARPDGWQDPAPSRLSYRLNRLWLTPLVRRFTRVGLPAMVLALSVGLYLQDAGRQVTLSPASFRSSARSRTGRNSW